MRDILHLGMVKSTKRIATAVLIPLAVAGILALLRTVASSFGVLSTVGFMPHRMCLNGAPWLIVTDAVADVMIGICYAMIPSMLIRVFRHGVIIAPADTAKISQASKLLPWFAAFISSCGMTHFASALTLWMPYYYIESVLKVVTVVASTGTCIVLYQQLPVLMGIVSNADIMVKFEKMATEIELMRMALSAKADQNPA